MNGLKSRAGRLTLVAAAAAATLAVSTSAAQADVTNLYHPDAASRAFNGGTGGWTNSTDQTGLCIPPLTCPSINNAYQANGGPGGPGDGYLESDLFALLGAVQASSSGIWESPAFTYNGVNGAAPDFVVFAMNRRADVGQLLAASGTNAATYTVDLVDVTSPAGTIPLIANAPLSGATSWSLTPAVSVLPAQLFAGHSYMFRITTTYETALAAVLINGSADYDNVTLAAVDITGPTTPPPGGGGGGGGGNGGNGGNGGGGASAAQAASLGGAANLVGKKLFVVAKCKKKARSACKMKITALMKKKGPKASKTAKATVKPGKKKKVALKIKSDKKLEKIAGKKKVWVKQKTKVKGSSATKVKKLKLKVG